MDLRLLVGQGFGPAAGLPPGAGTLRQPVAPAILSPVSVAAKLYGHFGPVFNGCRSFRNTPVLAS